MMFSYFEYVGDDFDADMAKMAADPTTRKWWDVCKPLLDPLETSAPEELSRMYNEVIGASVFMSAHPSAISTGPRTIPPPIPTSPEIMPIAMPNNSEGKTGGFLERRCSALFLANSIWSDAQIRAIANMAWKLVEDATMLRAQAVGRRIVGSEFQKDMTLR